MDADAGVELGVASLNLHGGRDRAGRHYSVAAALSRVSADVVVVQENWRPRHQESVARQAAAQAGFPEVIELDLLGDTALYRLGLVPSLATDEPGAWGLAVLSRVPLAAREPVWLGAAPRDPAPRMAQVVDVDLPGGPVVRLVNVHLTHRLRHGPSQLRRLLRSLAAGPRPAGPTVVAGDFNMCRPAIYMARGYRSAVRGRTWPADRPVAQLDHVLAGPGIRIARSGVVASTGSDHRPVRAVLRVSR